MSGVPAAKIIAKYGKKAYDAAKVAIKSKDKSVWSKLSKKDAKKFILNPEIIKQMSLSSRRIIEEKFSLKLVSQEFLKLLD